MTWTSSYERKTALTENHSEAEQTVAGVRQRGSATFVPSLPPVLGSYGDGSLQCCGDTDSFSATVRGRQGQD